jgi:hypothetical protein
VNSKGRSPIETIRPIFEKLAGQNEPITITRLIKGMCFTQEVEIVSVSHDFAVFQTSDIRLYASSEGHFILHSPLFSAPVTAHQVDSHISGCVFVLSDFTYLPNAYTERSQDRVQPKMPTYISVACGQKTISVDLVDLNASGIGVFAKKNLSKWANLGLFTSVNLEIHLRPGFEWDDLQGTIINFAPANHLLMKIGIQLHPNVSQSRLLESYMVQRKQEILEEIDRVFCQAMEPRKVEDQFF